jgi:O-antigen/teichoic acid export membrane protein
MTTQKLKILKDTASLNIALIIGQGLAVLQTLIIMRFLDPAMYGLWLGLMILLSYSSFAHMGLEYGMGMRLLYHQGQGNVARVTPIQDTAFTMWSGLSLILALSVFGYALFIPQSSPIEKLGLIIISGLIISEQQIAFLGRWQTSYLKDFKLVSLSSILRALLSFVLFVPLAYLYNVTGVMIGALVVSGIMLIFWWVKTSYRPHIQFSWDAFWEILRIGFPILLVVLGGILISTVDRLIVLNLLGAASLGYYGITSFGGGSVYQLLSQAGGSMGPHMVEDLGRSGGSVQSLHKYLIKPTLLFSYISVLLITGLVFFVPFLVTWLLPRYVPGILAFYIFTSGFFFLSIILTANNILNGVLMIKGTQRFVVYIQCIAIVMEIFSAILFIHVGWDIAGVALASALTCAFYGLSILYLAAHYVILDLRERFRFLGSVLMPFPYALTVVLSVLWLGRQIILGSSFGRLVLQCALTALLYCPLFYYLNKKIDLMREMDSLITAVRERFRLIGAKMSQVKILS